VIKGFLMSREGDVLLQSWRKKKGVNGLSAYQTNIRRPTRRKSGAERKNIDGRSKEGKKK